MNKRNHYEKKSASKTFYITSVIAIIAVIASIFAMRYTSNKLTEALPDNTDLFPTAPSITNQAGNEVTSVPDTRDEPSESEFETENEVTDEAPAQQLEENETTEKITQQAAAQITNTEFILPLGDAGIIKDFSPTIPIENKTMGDWRVHNGIDFEANEGDEVHSVGNGVVTKVISDTKWGYVIEVDHGSFTGRYCCLDQENAVGIDTQLNAGDVIGRLAAIPSESADGFHLHFEAVRDGKYIDPLEALEMR